MVGVGRPAWLSPALLRGSDGRGGWGYLGRGFGSSGRGAQMPAFRWSAVNGGGDVVHGVMEAADRHTVVEQLQRQGQRVFRPDPGGRRRWFGELLQIEIGGARGLDKAALGEVTRELAIML